MRHGALARASGALLVAAVAALVGAEVVARLVRVALVGITRRDHPSRSLLDPLVERPIRIIRTTLFFATFAALSLPALDSAGLRPAAGLDAGGLVLWLFGSGLRVVL